MQAYIDMEYQREQPPDVIPVYFSGCDFNCPYCYVPGMLSFSEDKLVDVKDVKRYIDTMHGRSVLFTGGEPCLQRQALLSLARFAKKKGLKTILDTNGSKPHSLKSLLFSDLVDEVWMDIKTPMSAEHFSRVTRSETFFVRTEEIIANLRESLQILKGYEDRIRIVFVTVVTPSLVFKIEDMLDIAEIVSDFRCIWRLTPFLGVDEHVSRRYSDISSPSMKFLSTLKEDCEQDYPQLLIELG